jgi:hypothetical protein
MVDACWRVWEPLKIEMHYTHVMGSDPPNKKNHIPIGSFVQCLAVTATCKQMASLSLLVDIFTKTEQLVSRVSPHISGTDIDTPVSEKCIRVKIPRSKPTRQVYDHFFAHLSINNSKMAVGRRRSDQNQFISVKLGNQTHRYVNSTENESENCFKLR